MLVRKKKWPPFWDVPIRKPTLKRRETSGRHDTGRYISQNAPAGSPAIANERLFLQ
jgi:hypothetical protein